MSDARWAPLAENFFASRPLFDGLKPGLAVDFIRSEVTPLFEKAGDAERTTLPEAFLPLPQSWRSSEADRPGALAQANIEGGFLAGALLEELTRDNGRSADHFFSVNKIFRAETVDDIPFVLGRVRDLGDAARRSLKEHFSRVREVVQMAQTGDRSYLEALFEHSTLRLNGVEVAPVAVGVNGADRIGSDILRERQVAGQPSLTGRSILRPDLELGPHFKKNLRVVMATSRATGEFRGLPVAAAADRIVAVVEDELSPWKTVLLDWEKVERITAKAADVAAGRRRYPVSAKDLSRALEDGNMAPDNGARWAWLQEPNTCSIYSLANAMNAGGTRISVPEVIEIAGADKGLDKMARRVKRGEMSTRDLVILMHQTVARRKGVGIRPVHSREMFKTIGREGRGVVAHLWRAFPERPGKYFPHLVYVEGVVEARGARPRLFVSVIDSDAGIGGRTFYPIQDFAYIQDGDPHMIDPNPAPAPPSAARVRLNRNRRVYPRDP